MAVVTVQTEDRPQSYPEKPEPETNMGIPHVTSFCCCYGLETGAKIVAYLHLLVSFCFVVLCSIYAAKFGAIAGTTDDLDGLYTSFYKITIGVAVTSVGHVLLASCLLYGVHKRSTAALRVWVYVMSALFVLAILGIVINCSLTGISGSGSEIFLSFLEGVLVFGVIAYCILTVNSFYLMLKSSEDMEGPTNTPY
ncbi:hypothetical protein NE865_09166 [Phthorimaea operculella]|nr:hypothetical protein NE865_09166 [Phthorimaea operculella]